MENCPGQLKLVRMYFYIVIILSLCAALSVILKQHPPSELLNYTDMNLTVQGLIPYTGQ